MKFINLQLDQLIKKRKNAKLPISGIKEGNIITDPTDIKKTKTKYYEQLCQ